MSDKREVKIVAAGSGAARNNIYRETTVPLAVLPKNIMDTSEVSTRHSKKKQIMATFSATLGCLLNGTVLGYTAPAIPSLMNPAGTDLYGNRFTLTYQQASWITGLLSLGCFFGCIIAGPIMEKLGRKKTLLYITSTWFFAGYMCIFLASHVAWIYVGRFLCGMGLGFELAVATVYIVEIASTDMRGILGCFVQFMGSIGVLAAYTFGTFLNWYWLALANSLFVAVFVLGMACVPESPRWLILKGKDFSASKSLEWLRGRSDPSADAAVDREIEKIKRDIAAKKRERVSLTQLKTAWKPFMVSLGMMFLLQFSGLNVIVFYAVSIFQMASSSVDPNVASIIVGVVLLVSCIVALAVVSRLNRKIMLVVSMLGMGICHIVLAICFYVNEEMVAEQQKGAAAPPTTATTVLPYYGSTKSINFNTTLPGGEYDHRPAVLGWLPLVTVIVYLFLGNVGYGTLIWVVTAELLPPKVRSISNSIIICFAFLCGFVIAKTFVDLLEGLGQSGTFFLYGGLCVLGTLFTAIFVPETRGKSIEEIEKFYHRGSSRRKSHEREPQVETPLKPIHT